MQSFRSSTLLRLVLCVSGIALVASGTSYAQDGWQMDESLAARKADIFNAFKAGNIDSDRQGLENFFNNYFFSRWTQSANSGQVQLYARELLTQDFKDIGGNARDYLLNTTFSMLQKMAGDPTVTPAARYNAVLTIGQLNQREAPNRNSPPVGYAQAVPYLVSQYGNKTNPDYIRIAALLGIVRHAQIGIADAAQLQAATDLFVSIVQSDKPRQDGDRDDQELKDWARLRAMDGLGALKNLAANDSIRDAVIAVIENPLESLEVRARAAKLFGEWDLAAAVASGATISFQRIGTVLLALTKSICDTELQAIIDMRDKERAETGTAAPVPGAAEEGIDFDQLTPPQKIELIAAVKRIKSEFLDVLYGIRGPRLSGSTTIGVLAVLPSEDPVAVKLNAATKAMGQMFKILDEGPPEDPNAPLAAGPRPPRPAPAPRGQQQKDEPITLNVNLVIVRDELQNFSALLAGIIAGGV